MNRNLRTALLASFIVVLMAAAGIVIWAENPLGPEPSALDALRSDSQVSITQDNWIVFEPTGKQPSTGFIFYPGGRVDARAYAPLLRDIAAEEYLVVLVPMPLNLAVFSPARAEAVIADFPQIEHWVIGGHSLGGAMTANFAYTYPDQVDGLVLWASYPANSNDLSGYDLAVLSIYGTRDMAGMEPFDASHALLPADTTWVQIEGGNHAQFGDYGLQPGDNVATISKQAQWQQIVSATLTFMDGLSR